MKETWKLLGIYILVLFFLVLCSVKAFSQTIKVRYFNAEWNDANKVTWCHTNKKGLDDCKVYVYDIGKDAESQKKYGIVVVPTIIIFNGKEVKRYQADLSFEIVAKLEDVQDVIDEILMEDF